MAIPKKNDIDKKIDKARAKNRQINYFVMRKVWGMLRPRGKETIYNNLDIKRERYTRAIDTGRIRLTENELLNLVETTGISADIFEGKTHFYIEGVTEDEWERLFELRESKRDGSTEADIKKYKKASDIVSKKIEDCNRKDLIGNRDFWTLCYYAENLTRFPKSLIATQGIKAIDVIKEISFEEFEVYETAQLIHIQSVLDQQLKKVRAIVDYRNMKTTV